MKAAILLGALTVAAGASMALAGRDEPATRVVFVTEMAKAFELNALAQADTAGVLDEADG